ncbi:GNAT family N-acetyltransferase [Agrilactobacillus fermenti]|uniref:GNAT family N-acetyltransferase n=1 Tax=Agrilactobacillus fermenti TaxID=2586909 RepID=UPI001E2F5876|nr:GNAT family N-acetyltransferase [Agrilactobacillus fermenti]MCD2256348.1 GNAT family N-acetyltransferase [Agrilactobacillus fermenti]
MTNIRLLEPKDDQVMAQIIRQSLAAVGLAKPGTAYFDPELMHLSQYYQATVKRAYFVAVDATAQVIGGVGIGEFDEANGIAELQKLYIQPQNRGAGLSYQLVQQALRFAKAAGYQRVYLETHHTLKAAIHLYRKMGFQPIKPDPKTLEHNAMDVFFSKAI